MKELYGKTLNSGITDCYCRQKIPAAMRRSECEVGR
jgi:hypothetical protein